MEYIVQLRHFTSGNVEVAQIEEKFKKKFSFLEKLANNDIPAIIKIKQKGKNINGAWNQRTDAFHMRINFQLKTGEDFMYEAEGFNFDEAFQNLRKGTKENAAQRLDKKHTKHQYRLQQAKENLETHEELELDIEDFEDEE